LSRSLLSTRHCSNYNRNYVNSKTPQPQTVDVYFHQVPRPLSSREVPHKPTWPSLVSRCCRNFRQTPFSCALSEKCELSSSREGSLVPLTPKKLRNRPRQSNQCSPESWTTLRAGRYEVRIAAGAGEFYLPQNVQTGPEAHLDYYVVVTGSSCPWVNWPRREVGHSAKSNSEVENERSHTSPPPVFLTGMKNMTKVKVGKKYRMKGRQDFWEQEGWYTGRSN